VKQLVRNRGQGTEVGGPVDHRDWPGRHSSGHGRAQVDSDDMTEMTRERLCDAFPLTRTPRSCCPQAVAAAEPLWPHGPLVELAMSVMSMVPKYGSTKTPGKSGKGATALASVNTCCGAGGLRPVDRHRERLDRGVELAPTSLKLTLFEREAVCLALTPTAPPVGGTHLADERNRLTRWI